MNPQKQEHEFSFKDLFVPFTTLKAIQWISVIGLIVYLNSLFNGFVWDDEGQILNNTLVHSLSSIPSLLQGGTFIVGIGKIASNYYKPLLPITYTILFSIFGPQAFYFHLLQVVLHIANATMVFLLFAKFFNKKLTMFLSVIFLIHPINVEAVSYIAALQEPLFFFFGMLALLFIIYRKLRMIEMGVVFLFLFLSILSKETGFLFLGISFVYLLLFRNKKLLIYSLFSIGLVAIYLFLRLYFAAPHLVNQHLAPISQSPLLIRFYTMPSIILFYIKGFFFPVHLAISQDWLVKMPTLKNFLLPLLFDIVFFCCLLIFGIRLYFSNRKLFIIFIFFAMWLLIGFVLHLQLIPLDMTVAERWFYFPIVGLLGIGGILLQKIAINLKKEWILLIVILMLSLLGLRTYIRNSNWMNGQTLFPHDVKINTSSYSLENSAGVVFYKAGDYQQAEYHFLKSSRLAPYYWINWFDLGALAESRKQYDLAKKYYQTSIQTGDYEGGYLNLAILYIKLHDYTNAKAVSATALKKYPYDVPLRLALAASQYQVGDYSDALQNAKQAHTLLSNDNTNYFLSTISQKLPLDLNFK